jgi:hypothetical protein
MRHGEHGDDTGILIDAADDGRNIPSAVAYRLEEGWNLAARRPSSSSQAPHNAD